MNSSNLPIAFIEFLEKELGEDHCYFDYFKEPIPRYVRFKPGEHIKSLIKEKTDIPLKRLEWMPDFYSLPSDYRLSENDYYKQGLIYGLDVSSGLAVKALDINQNDHILDICCAPGGKLVYIADLIGQSGTGTVTGVDINKTRLSICKSLIRKYKHNRVRLFCHDGTTFNIRPPNRIGNVILEESNDNFSINRQKIKPFHASRLIRNDDQSGRQLYDKVIVDAECTHDGSIAHIEKYLKNNWENFDTQFLDTKRLEGLQDLQRCLLKNGFSLLKAGGILVYSTCSFSKKQNEDIISWFLEHNRDAILERIPGHETVPSAQSFIQDCIRMNPLTSNTSGFFLARIRKISLKRRI